MGICLGFLTEDKAFRRRRVNLIWSGKEKMEKISCQAEFGFHIYRKIWQDSEKWFKNKILGTGSKIVPRNREYFCLSILKATAEWQ